MSHAKGALALLTLFLLAPATATQTSPASNAVASPFERPAIKTALGPRSAMMQVVRAGDRLVAVGERGLIQFSDDNGRSWMQADVPTSVTLTATSFPTPQTGWAVGHYGIVLRTDDGGQSWKRQLDGGLAAQLAQQRADALLGEYQAAHPEDAETPSLVAQADPSDLDAEAEDLDVPVVAPEKARLQRLHKDARWLVESGPDKPFFDVHFRDTLSGFVVGAFGLVFTTRDGGQTWQSRIDRLDNPFGSHLYDLRWVGSSLFIAGEKGALFRSDDGGEHFARVQTPFEGTYFGFLPVAKGTRALLLGLKGNLLFSDATWENWTPIQTKVNVSSFDGTVLGDGTVVLAMENGQMLVSRDDGRTFAAISPAMSYPFTSVVQAADGGIVVSGIGGLQRLAVDDLKEQTR